MKHVASLSGGAGSWAAAKRVVERHGTEHLDVIFADVLVEDADTYRFLIEGAANIYGVPLSDVADLARRALALPDPLQRHSERRHDLLRDLAFDSMERIPGLKWMADGRTIWEVFKERRFLGNSRVDPCSMVLKREIISKWRDSTYGPASTTMYVGIDWTEIHRFDREPGTRGAKDRGGIKQLYAEQGWTYEAPLCEEPYLDKPDVHTWAEREGLEKQRLYKMGAAHANCAGGCIKMGHGGFANLLKTDPCMFAEWEQNEQEMREFLEKDVAILKDRSGGGNRPLTLTELRERIVAGDDSIDLLDFGGCGCFVEVDDA